jgi:hypothetical protein
MPRKRRYSDDEFRTAVRESISIQQVLHKIGLRNSGGNSTHFKFIANRLGIDYSHFLGSAHLRGKRHNWSKKLPLSQILIEKSAYSNRCNLKRRLIKEGLMKNFCAICSIYQWLEKPIALHLDHINGVCDDNRLENLRLLCPNCHSQTETYGGKNKKSTR